MSEILNAETVETVGAGTVEGPKANTDKGAGKAAKEKMVKIRIPKGRKDQGDEVVGVNGVLYQIKVGVTVEVPVSVAEVLQHRDEMLETIQEFEEANARDT